MTDLLLEINRFVDKGRVDRWKGCHSRILKRSKVIAKIKGENIQVAFGQDTHLSNWEHEKLKKGWGLSTRFIPLTNLGIKGEWRSYFPSYTSN